LLSGSVATIIKGVCIFFSGNYRYIKVFKPLAYLSIRAYLAILPKGLYYCNLLLLKGPSYLNITAFYKVSMEFLFRLSRDFLERIVGINKNVNNLVFKASCPFKRSRKDLNIRGTYRYGAIRTRLWNKID